MIWESIVLMSIIDLLIISVSVTSLSLFYIHRSKLIQSGTLFGSSAVVIGLITVGFFYFTDLLIMWVLPLFTARATAMAVMESLQ